MSEIPEELTFIKNLEVVDFTRNPINAFTVSNKYKNSLITEEHGISLLKWLLEGSDDPVVRVDSLEALEKLLINSTQLPRLSNLYFQIFENSLVTDDRGFVRNVAAQKIISHFADEGQETLTWAAENDKSLLVLKVLYDKVEDYNSLAFLKPIVANRLSRFYNVVPEEFKIIMDLQLRQGYGTTYYDHFPRRFTETTIE